jgi:hypothetical protein
VEATKQKEEKRKKGGSADAMPKPEEQEGMP